MRLRNIPRAEGTIQAHHTVIRRPEDQRGCWRQVFGNKNPLSIEIGMGKGKFILDMAKRYPDVNFVGIERYSSVLLRAVERFDTEEYNELKNVRFVCMDARNVADVFAEGEVTRIYLNFSDPWPKDRHAKRRLTARNFLESYDKLFRGNPHIVMKTDNDNLFQYSLESFKEYGYKINKISYDLHSETLDNVETEYEEKFSKNGIKIKYVDVSK